MTDWRPMTEHAFPWPHQDLVVMAFFKEDRLNVEIIRCHVAEHGALFFNDGGWLTLNEQGWIPYAWRLDDLPSPDDDRFPPMWTDYLTETDAADR